MAVLVAALALAEVVVFTQDRLRTLPGYDQYQRMVREIPTAVRSGALSITWSDDGLAFEYAKDGRRYRFDVAMRQETETTSTGASGRAGRGAAGGPGQPERGRQFELALSPDGTLKAFYRDRNLWLSAADGTSEVAVTTDGSAASRVKYGTASWGYGEELDQRTAMWWSPDGRKLAYYRFDESKVPDYYVALNQTDRQTTLDTEAYPKAGAPNPLVDVFVYDVSTRQSIRVDVRDGKPFDNEVVGH